MSATNLATSDRIARIHEAGADELSLRFNRIHAASRRQPYPELAWRQARLRALKEALLKERQALAEAAARDFGWRSHDETLMADILPVVNGIKHSLGHLRRWMKPSRRPVHAMFQPAKARLYYQPLGVVGIIVPWNYPIQLALAPLACAVGAGNRALLKLSEFTPETNAVVERIVQAAFTEDEVAVVHGGVDIAEAFTRLPFDHLIFTGSTPVGRKVMAAAAANLTPVTLELGGKSPAIVDADAPLAASAERIIFGKTLNAGQTCIAPDYLLVQRDRVDALVSELQRAFARMYPSLRDNRDYTALIHDRHHRRMLNLLTEAQERGAQVIACNPKQEDLDGTRKLPLQLVLGAPEDTALMQEEIFGPILPIVGVDDLDGAIAEVTRRPRPLALYYFGNDGSRQQRVLNETHAGGVCLNNTLLHIAQDSLPFGGIGDSGMGHYHGHEGFLTLSKQKSVFIQGKPNVSKVAYPPYGGLMQKLIQTVFVR